MKDQSDHYTNPFEQPENQTSGEGRPARRHRKPIDMSLFEDPAPDAAPESTDEPAGWRAPARHGAPENAPAAEPSGR